MNLPTDPATLARDPRYPDDVGLYRELRDHSGKLEADRLWFGAGPSATDRESELSTPVAGHRADASELKDAA